MLICKCMSRSERIFKSIGLKFTKKTFKNKLIYKLLLPCGYFMKVKNVH